MAKKKIEQEVIQNEQEVIQNEQEADQVRTAPAKDAKGKTKKENQLPIVEFRGSRYEIKEKAGDTIRLSDGLKEFCVLASETEPTTKAAKEILRK